MKMVLFFLCIFVHLQASIFDWFSPLSERAKRGKAAMEELDPMIEQAMKDYQVPGVAIGVVVDGHVVYAKGFGFRDIEKKLPVTKDTVFPIGSCTKAFSTFAIATLVDEGLLYWDQKVVDVYPEFRLFDSYATQNLTFRDLLTHRSGMARHDFMWYNSCLTKLEVMQKLRYLEPSCDLRERYIYNNLMYFAAGYIVEQLIDQSWEELVQERILTPLGMKSTGFSLSEMQKTEDFALPYTYKEGRMQKMGFRDISLIGPAGALNSNVTDLVPWVMMQLNEGVHNEVRQINAALLQETQTPQVIVPGAPETSESQIYAYGLGWCIAGYRGQYLLSHDGVSEGFTSTVAILPLQKVGVIVLCNRHMTNFSRVLSCEAVDRVLELKPIDWFKEGLKGAEKLQLSTDEDLWKEDQLRKKGTSPSHSLQDYAGCFEHPAYGTIIVDVVGDCLQVDFNGIVSELDHWHYDTFQIASENQHVFFSRIGTKVTFRDNWNGDIEEISIPFEPNVSDIVFKRKKQHVDHQANYYRKFLGLYEIYGYSVEIVLRNHTLCAVIPGQPTYELVPGAENEFTVKSMTGYNLRFVLDADGKVEEVLLMQPYGTFVAHPKKGHP